MAISICLLALWHLRSSPIASTAQQDRAFSFLSYKDTIFAIRQRATWAPPTHATQFPNDAMQLEALGLNAIRGSFSASLEGWDGKAGCWNVACEDFDDVMCLAQPQYPRRVLPLPGAGNAMRAKALKLFAYYLGKKQVKLSEPEVYSADLDGSKKPVKIVSVSASCENKNPGLVFLDSPTTGPHVLCYSKDGWPHLLTVADLLEDGHMEVIVGGTTVAGKAVAMYRYDRGRLSQLAEFQSPE